MIRKKAITLYKVRKITWGVHRNQQEPISDSGCKHVDLSFHKRVHRTPVLEECSKKLILEDSFHCAQLSWHSQTAVAMVQRDPVTVSVGSWSWLYSLGGDFISMNNTTVLGSGKPSSGSHRKAVEKRNTSEVNVWSCGNKAEDSRKLEMSKRWYIHQAKLPCKSGARPRSCVGCNQHDQRGGASRTLENLQFTTLCCRCQTWSTGI